MFNWFKKSIAPATESNIDYLNFYLSVIRGTDNQHINEGDFVNLKEHPALPKKYAGCSSFLEASKTDTVFAYVLSLKDLPPIHTELGNALNAIIAFYRGNSVRISACDSRLFRTINNESLAKVPQQLKEFVTDTPDISPYIGQLVRSRMHCEITNPLHFSNLLEEKFLEPFIVLSVDDDKVILGGMLSSTGDKIHEVSTYSNLICAV